MSEREEEPATRSGTNQLPISQEGEQHNQVIQRGGIQAETITDVTNLVVGEQYIGVQNIIVLREQSQKRMPPLLRWRRAEHFTDRETEKIWLQDNLKPGRIVTVCAPGGMGKTALVAEVLWTLAPGDTPPDAFPDGLFFYRFYGQPEAAIALEQIARVFGEEPVPTPALAAQRALSGRCALIVLDGAEEATNLGQVLDVCVDCAVLVTTQRRDNVSDTLYLLDLQELDISDAITIVQKWGKKRAADEALITQIYGIVGGLPLALLLVGRYLNVHQEEASEYLLWLKEAPLRTLDRDTSKSESISRVLERSITKLSGFAREALAIIGFLALAPFHREVVIKALRSSSRATSQALGELVNYGLLSYLGGMYEVSHPLIHTYTREVLLARYETIKQRDLAEQIVRTLAEMFPEVTRTNWQVCGVLLPHVQACAPLVEQYELVFPEAARLLHRAGHYLHEHAQYTQAEPLYQQALTLYRGLGDSGGEGEVLASLSRVNDALGKGKPAQSYAEQALSVYKKLRDPDGEAMALNSLGRIFWKFGPKESAQEHFEQALDIYEKRGDKKGKGTTLTYLGWIYRDLGLKQRDDQARKYYEQAQGYYEQALTLFREVGDLRGEGRTLNHLGRIYYLLGQYEWSVDFCEQASVLLKGAGDRVWQATALNNLGRVYTSLGEREKAKENLKQAWSLRRDIQDRWAEGRTLEDIGIFYWEQGRYGVTLCCFLLAISIFLEIVSSSRNETQRSIEELRDKIGDEQFAAALLELRSQRPQIIEQGLQKEIDEEQFTEALMELRLQLHQIIEQALQEKEE